MGITRFRILKTKIVLVGKFKYSKKEKEDMLSKHTTWNEYNLGIWFKKNRIVGAKNVNKPSKWGNNLVNDYMVGINLFIVKGWINWNTGGASMNSDNKKKTKNSFYYTNIDKYDYEVTATDVYRRGNIYKGMPEADIIIEIYESTLSRLGKQKTKYLMYVDEDYISDCLGEINQMMNHGIESR